MKPDLLYQRKEDMSPDGELRLLMQDDGDIIVEVWGHNSCSQPLLRVQVEFCSIGAGGGRSPHTREALIALAIAIAQDNAEQAI